MKAGVSYSDWRLMTQWQRTSLLLRFKHRDMIFGQKLKDADKMGDSLGLILGRILGLD